MSVVGLLLNNLIFALTTPLFNLILETLTFVPEAIPGWIPAKMLATVTVLFWNFFVNRYWTYGDVE